MHLISTRILSFLVTTAILLGLVPALAHPGSASAQTDALTQKEFRALVREAEAEDPAFGPEEGELLADPDTVSLAKADVDLEDLLIEATFVNPQAADDHAFDIGLQIRSSKAGYIRFIVLSSGAFGISDSEADELLLTGKYGDLDLEEGGENDLTLYAEGDTVHVAINGDYVGSAEVVTADSGDAAVGATFLADSLVDESVTEYTDFTIWELGGSSLGQLGKKTATPEEEPTKKTTKKTATPEEEATKKTTRKTPTPEEEPTKKSTKKTPVASDGAVFAAENYDFGFTYDPEQWEVSSSLLDSGAEFITLAGPSGTSLFVIVTDQFDGNVDDCFNGLLNVTSGIIDDENAELNSKDGQQAITKGNRAGSVAITFDISSANGDLTAYAECGPVNDSTFLVGVIQISQPDAYVTIASVRDDMVDTFGSIDDQGNTKGGTDEDPTAEPTKKSTKKTPTPEQTGSGGTVFTAENFDFAFRYDESVWEVTSNPLDNGDLLSLNREGSLLLAFLVSDQFDDLQNCLNIMAGYGTSVLEGVGATGDLNMQGDPVEITKGNRAGSVAITANFIVTSGDFPDVIYYIECGPVNDSSFMVGVIQIALEATFEADAEARQLIVDTFGSVDDVQSGGQDPEPTKASTKKTATPKSGSNGGTKISDHVIAYEDGGALYTSPSFGFQVGILSGYTVEEDSVQNGYDTLVIASDTGRVTYSMFASTSAPTGCIASIVNNLRNTAGYTNVQVATANDGTELSGTGDGYAYTVVLFTANGQDIARYYACFGGGSGGAILVFAYESPLAIFADQVDEIEKMLDQIIIPE